MSSYEHVKKKLTFFICTPLLFIVSLCLLINNTFDMKYEKKQGIYQILNLINNKCYVGSSIDILHRFSWHRNMLRKSKHSNKHLEHAWIKYGENNFVFRILEKLDNPTKEYLEEREDYWIEFYDTINEEKGYNKQNAKQGSFCEKWHLKEKERKVGYQAIKDYDYYNTRKYFSDVPQENKYLIISNLLKYTQTHSVKVIRKEYSNYLQIILTNDKEEKIIYVSLNPLKVLTEQEYKQIIQDSKKVRGGLIYRIKPGTSDIEESFFQPVDILNKYPQIKRKSLERILYNKGNFSSTQGMIFVKESEYDSNKNYYIGKFKEKEPKQTQPKEVSIIYELNESNEIIREFKGLNSIITQYPDIKKKDLEKVLYTNRKSTKGHYFVLAKNYFTK